MAFGEISDMARVVLYIAASIDGYIAREDGAVDWLDVVAGEHLAHWKAPVGGKSTSTHVHVPVFRKNKNWATVEIRFAPLWTNNLASGFTNSFVGLLVFTALGGFLCYFFVLKKSLRELDPSAVVPERVQKAFDVMQDGVLILD